MDNDDPFSEHSVHNGCSDGNVLVSSYYIYYITPKTLFLKRGNTNDVNNVFAERPLRLLSYRNKKNLPTRPASKQSKQLIPYHGIQYNMLVLADRRYTRQNCIPISFDQASLRIFQFHRNLCCTKQKIYRITCKWPKYSALLHIDWGLNCVQGVEECSSLLKVHALKLPSISGAMRGVWDTAVSFCLKRPRDGKHHRERKSLVL